MTDTPQSGYVDREPDMAPPALSFDLGEEDVVLEVYPSGHARLYSPDPLTGGEVWLTPTEWETLCRAARLVPALLDPGVEVMGVAVP